MADYKDLDEFGFEPIEEINDDELSEFGFEPELELPQQEIEPEEMGAAEAALTGFGQGASFGLTPIIAGATGAAGEVIEDIGDVLGLTTDAELEKKGFKVQDDYEGLQGLVDAYYAQRDRQRAQEEQAFEDQPVANIVGNIAGGLTSMGGTAKATGALGKLLPKAESVKGLSTLGKAGVAAREGAKAGALAGFGAGEGKLLEGELAKTARETAGTALGGAAFGGGLSLGGSALKKGGELIAETPFAKNIGLGFEAGQRGINISDDKQITDFVRKTTSDIRKSISKNFKGASKKQILEQADELGIRVAAGESIDVIINEIKESGAFGKKAQKELNQFVEDLRNLSVADDVARDKLKKKLEEQAAKKLSKAERQGEMFRRRDEFESTFDELAPTQQEGSVLGIEDIVDRPYEQPRKILTQGTLVESEVPMKQYDLDALKLSELDEIISKVGTRAYEGTDDAAVPYAKQLYATLRELSNDAMQESSLPEKNKKLKALFDGLESLDIKPKDFFSSREVIQDAVENKIQSKLIASPLSTSDNKMKNFLKYLARADEDLARKITKESDFASDIAKFAKQSEGEGSVSLKAAAGPIQKILAKVGNIAGSGLKGAQESRKQVMQGLKDMTPDNVTELGTLMTQKYGDSANAFINQLNKAVNSPGQRKNALMYGIYQQPAFRKMLEGLGRNIVGEDEEQEVENNESVNDFFNADDSVGFDKKKVGREPQGIFDKAVMSESSGGKFRDNRKNKSDVPSVGSLQFIEETAKGFLENNPQYKQNFEGMDFNSDSFFNKWNNLEDNDPNFLKDTKKYLKQTNLDPVLREFEIDPRDMQSYASLSTQLGPRLLKKAIENAGSTDINDVTNYLIDNIDRFFKTYKSKGGDLTPIVNRFKNMQR
jgi:hypothetical protein